MCASLKWSPRPDLNWWPLRYQRSALPTELHGRMVGMLGLEPRNPEGADLQSAAVAAVPHPHSVFKHLWESSTPQAEMNNKRLLKTCQRKPRRRAYSCHKTYTCGRPGDVALPAQLRLRLSRSLRSRIAGRATSPGLVRGLARETMSWSQVNLSRGVLRLA